MFIKKFFTGRVLFAVKELLSNRSSEFYAILVGAVGHFLVMQGVLTAEQWKMYEAGIVVYVVGRFTKKLATPTNVQEVQKAMVAGKVPVSGG